MNTLLKLHILNKYGTQKEFAYTLLIKPEALSRKLNGKSPWKIKELKKTLELLDLTEAEVYELVLRAEGETKKLMETLSDLEKAKLRIKIGI